MNNSNKNNTEKDKNLKILPEITEKKIVKDILSSEYRFIMKIFFNKIR